MGLFRWKPQEEAQEQDQKMRRGERLERDLSKFLLASALAFFGLLPYILGISFAVSTHAVFPVLATGILGGMIAAPELCGLVDTILRSMRDDVGIWWQQYRHAWKQNVRASLLPGALFGLIFAMQIFAVMHIGLLDYPGIQLFTLCLTTVLLLGVAAYLVPTLVLMELPFAAMLKNSLLLFLRHLLKSLTAALILFVFLAFLTLWFPISTVLLLMGGLWVPVMLSCKIVYPILDDTFGLTEAFEEAKKR